MANFENQVELFKQSVPLFDEKAHQAARTGVLDGASEMARPGANADELIVQVIDTDGLGNYDKNTGYPKGGVRTRNETIKCNFDRGMSFQIDYIDNVDTQNTLLVGTIGNFMDAHVIPELDAFRFSKYAQQPGVTVHAPEAIKSGEEAVKRLRLGVSTLDKNSIPKDQRYLFITSDLKGQIDDMNTTNSRRVLDGFADIIEVEPNRFYSAIDQLENGYKVSPVNPEKVVSFRGDSSKKDFEITQDIPNWLDKVTVNGTAKTEGKDYTYSVVSDNLARKKGVLHFNTAPGAEDIKASYGAGHALNFMIVWKPAVIQYTKHVDPKIVDPNANNTANAWLYGYRNVGIARGWENKVKGIYVDMDKDPVDPGK